MRLITRKSAMLFMVYLASFNSSAFALYIMNWPTRYEMYQSDTPDTVINIVAHNESMSVNGKALAPIFSGSPSGLMRFPSGEYSHIEVSKIYDVVKSIKSTNSKIIVNSDPDVTYAFWKPVLRAIADGGKQIVSFEDEERTTVPVGLYLTKVHDKLYYPENENSTEITIQLKSNSVSVDYKDSRRKKREHQIISLRGERMSDLEKGQIGRMINGYISGAESYSWVYIDPYPDAKYKNLIDLIKLAHLGMKNDEGERVNVCLLGLYSIWDKAAIFKTSYSSKISPPEELFAAVPQYPNDALKRGVVSKVIAKVQIDAIGIVKNVEITQSGGKDFDSSVVKCLRKMIYSPYMIKGIGVPTVIHREFDFKLK